MAAIARPCTKCRKIKPLEEFSKAPNGKYGRKASCKECDAARHEASKPADWAPKNRKKPRRAPLTGDEIKTCSACKEAKPLSQFSLSRSASETCNAVYQSACKPCASARAMQWYRDNPERTLGNKRRFNLASLYGMTLEDYDILLRAQGGVCAVCRRSASGTNSRNMRLVVDHCHETNTVRGLLCHSCNRAIGLMGDDAVLLRRAISYLLRARQAKAG